MARRAEYLEQFPAGLVKSGPGYLVPGGALTRAENVRLDQTATLRRTFGHVNDGSVSVSPGSRTSGLLLHNDEGTLRKLLWAEDGGAAGKVDFFDGYSAVGSVTGLGAGDRWVDSCEIQRRSVHVIAADSAGSGAIRKYDGTNLRAVGLAAPGSAPVAALGDPDTAEIHDCDSGWTGTNVSHDSSIRLEGTNSVKLDFNTAGNGATIVATSPSGLTMPGSFSGSGDPITEDDYLVIWVWRGHNVFGVGAAVTQVTVDVTPKSGDYSSDYLTQTLAEATLREMAARNRFNGRHEDDIGGGGFTESWLPLFFRIRDFASAGTNYGGIQIADGEEIRVSVTYSDTIATSNIFLDQIQFWGGFDTNGFGRYYEPHIEELPLGSSISQTAGGIEFAVTFENEDGFESNAGPLTSDRIDPIREQVSLSSVPTGPAGTAKRHIYARAVGVDADLKRVGTIDDNVATTITISDTLSAAAAAPNNRDVPPNARYCAEYQDHLFLGATEDSEREYVFGLQGLDWEGFPNAPERLDDDIQGFGSMPGGLAILTTSSLWFLTGSGINDFVQSKVEGARGCIAPRSIVVTPLGLMYLAHDGIYLFTGSSLSRVTDRVTGIFDGTADVTLNRSRVEFAVGAWDTRRLRYVLAYPSGTSQLPDRALVLWFEHGWAATEEAWSADYMANDPHAGDLYLAHPESGGAIRVSTVGTQSDDFDGSSVTWDVETAEVASQPPARHLRKHYDAVWTEHAPATATIEVDVRIDEQDPPVSSVVTSDWRRSSDPRIMHRHKVSGSGLRASVRARGEGELDSLRFILLFEDEAAQ